MMFDLTAAVAQWVRAFTSQDAPCHSMRGTLKNLHCSMVMRAESRSKLNSRVGR